MRISGPCAIGIAKAIFRSKTGAAALHLESHRIKHGFIVDPETGEPIDEVLLNVMCAPKTFTMEDTVEINCHGGRTVLLKVLELAIASGARLAEPGEFTKRAFLNGRIDLAQAEAVIEVIRAKTEASLAAAMALLRGGLSKEIASLEEDLLGALANIEASIDFAEEGLEIASPESLRVCLSGCIDSLDALIDSYSRGRMARDGLAVVIAGRPNVGKSSLLNAILRHDRAIVSPFPGTTRDLIEESICIKGTPFKLQDTAGIRRARGPIEEQGVSRSREALERADLALLVVDGSIHLNGADRRLFSGAVSRRAICVLNKIDLPAAFGEDALRKELPGLRIVKVSALLGTGIEKLKEAIYQEAVEGDGRGEGAPLVLKLRHQQALKKAKSHLKKALRALQIGLSPEFVAIDIKGALGCLGDISGRDAGAALLDRIFEDFCIGK